MSHLSIGPGIPIANSFLSSSEAKLITEEVQKLIFRHGSKTVGHHGPFQRDDLPPGCELLARKVALLLHTLETTKSTDCNAIDTSHLNTEQIPTHWNALNCENIQNLSALEPFKPNQVDLCYIFPGSGLSNKIEAQQISSTPSVSVYISGNAVWDIVPTNNEENDNAVPPERSQIMVSFPNKSAAIFTHSFQAQYSRSLPSKSVSHGFPLSETHHADLIQDVKVSPGLRVITGQEVDGPPIEENKPKKIAIKRSPFICVTFRRFTEYCDKILSMEEYNQQQEQNHALFLSEAEKEKEANKPQPNASQAKARKPQKAIKAKPCEAVTMKETVSASKFEQDHVVSVYDTIAPHFSGTRYQSWPQVDRFIQGLSAGSFLADVGCGNGKYLGLNDKIITTGCDISTGLATIAHNKGHNVCISDALAVPYKSGYFDAAICIAVLHHLSTEERRISVLEELVRIVKCGGQVLVTAWAYEQELDSARVFSSGDVWVSWVIPDNLKQEIAQKNAAISLQHKGQTQQAESAQNTAPIVSSESDVTSVSTSTTTTTTTGEVTSVPDSINRYYHVFHQGEMEGLVEKLQAKRADLLSLQRPDIPYHEVAPITIAKSFYDKGNWCVILQKGEEPSI